MDIFGIPLSDLLRYGLYALLLFAFFAALFPRTAQAYTAPKAIAQVRVVGSAVQAVFDNGLVMTVASSGSTIPVAGPLATWCDQAYIWPLGFAGTAYFVDARGVEHIAFRRSSK